MCVSYGFAVGGRRVIRCVVRRGSPTFHAVEANKINSHLGVLLLVQRSCVCAARESEPFQQLVDVILPLSFRSISHFHLFLLQDSTKLSKNPIIYALHYHTLSRSKLYNHAVLLFCEPRLINPCLLLFSFLEALVFPSHRRVELPKNGYNLTPVSST